MFFPPRPRSSYVVRRSRCKFDQTFLSFSFIVVSSIEVGSKFTNLSTFAKEGGYYFVERKWEVFGKKNNRWFKRGDDQVNCATSEITGRATKLLASITSTSRQFVVTHETNYPKSRTILPCIYRIVRIVKSSMIWSSILRIPPFPFP